MSCVVNGVCVFNTLRSKKNSKKHLCIFFGVFLLLCLCSAVSVGDWNNAASHLERSTVAIASQFGKESVELGRQLFKLAQLHFNR